MHSNEESFSWSEEVERSYMEADRVDRERREAADSPSRASQHSEVASFSISLARASVGAREWRTK